MSYTSNAPPDNGMRLSADTRLVVFLQTLGAPADAWRGAASPACEYIA